jgi:folate-binding protein YgfZ
VDKELAGLLQGATDLGDPEAEYRAFGASCALTLRADRGAVLVAGERRAEMLNGLVTNQVTDLEHTGRHALLLNRKGRVLTDLRVFPRAADLLLDIPRSGLENLLATFQKYLPPIYATFEDASDSLGQLGLYGPGTAAAFAAFGFQAPDEHRGVRAIVAGGGAGSAAALAIRARRLAGDGIELIAPREAISDLVERLLPVVREQGGRAAGSRALEVVRVESGIPRYGVDVSDANLTSEIGLEGEAVSFDKGCYLGQEIVARVHFLGQVKRALKTLRFSGSAASPEPPGTWEDLPTVGTVLCRGSDEVGTVTSAVLSPRFGPIGFGYVTTEIAVSEPRQEMTWSDAGRTGAAVLYGPPLQPFEGRSV